MLEINKFLIESPFVKWIVRFRPHRIVLSFYFSSFVSSRLPKKRVVIHIASGEANDLKMSLRIGDRSNPQETYYWLGFYEIDVQRIFHNMIRPGFIIYDIGAYLGFFSLLAGRLTGPKGRVFAFEPIPKNTERIQQHIHLNQMGWVFCISKAVMGKTGKARTKAYLDRDDWASFIEESDSLESGLELVVELTTLDEFVFREGHPAPNLIKIDVEGAEGEILSGAQRLLREFKPVVICELHGHELAKQVYEELNSLEYRFNNLRGHKLTSIPDYGHIIAQPEKGVLPNL